MRRGNFSKTEAGPEAGVVPAVAGVELPRAGGVARVKPG
jgi:hypothetical protein